MWDKLAEYGLPGAMGLLQGFVGGGGSDQENFLVLPQQRALLADMIARYYRGDDDYGLGGAIRSGSASLNQILASRGIDPRSGTAASALSQMIANAASQVAANRQQYGLALAQASPAFAAGRSQRFGWDDLFDYSPEGLQARPAHGGARAWTAPMIGRRPTLAAPGASAGGRRRLRDVTGGGY